MSDEWTKVAGGPVNYVKYSETEVGTEWIGVYLRKEIDATYGNNKYFLATDLGTTCLNGAGQLDHAMENVPKGKKIKVVYKGTVKLDKGKFKGKDCHQFEVFVAGGIDAVTVEETAGIAETGTKEQPAGPRPTMPTTAPSFEGVEESAIPFNEATRVHNPAYKRGASVAASKERTKKAMEDFLAKDTNG